MRPWGIQVSIIEPGLFKTTMANEERNIQSVQALWDGLSPELKQEYGEERLEKSETLKSSLYYKQEYGKGRLKKRKTLKSSHKQTHFLFWDR